MYEKALKNLGVKKIPDTLLARARLFAKLNQRMNKAIMKKKTGNGKAAYKERGLQIRTWGNYGEGY